MGSGGTVSAGGSVTAAGGSSGGLTSSGGLPSMGATTSIGGTTSTGGIPSTGGMTAVVGAGGSMASGGGTPATGGSVGSGGSTDGNGGTSVVSGGTTGDAGSTTGGVGGGAGTSNTDPDPGSFSRPEGTIPNAPQPDSAVGVPKSDWQKGLISPSMLNGHQLNQSSVLNGYLMVGGNEEFWIFDVSNPASPKQLSSMATPNRRVGGEAESHTISFARYGNTFYMVTIGGKGIDTWDVTSPTAPKHMGQLPVPGTNYGDYTEAVWGVSWQGQYIYVGATNNGLKVVDAADPAALKIVSEVPTSQYGGVSAGPVEAIGNVLVVMTPKENGGVATLDISDPTKPSRLASFSTGTSYIGQFHRHWVFLLGPLRAWDVLSNPSNIGSGSSPIGQLNTEGSEYMVFSDDYMFLGHVRAEIGGNPGASKVSVTDPTKMSIVERIWGRMNLGGLNDDQFTLPFGNLLMLSDDQSPYPGFVLAVHQADPDTTPPVVDTVIPKDQSMGVPVTSRIGVTFSDNIDLATVNAASFIVRPVGGQPLPGKYGVRMGVLNFDPDENLQPGTTYEVVLAKGGLADFVGNTLATEWKSTFTTN